MKCFHQACQSCHCSSCFRTPLSVVQPHNTLWGALLEHSGSQLAVHLLFLAEVDTRISSLIAQSFEPAWPGAAGDEKQISVVFCLRMCLLSMGRRQEVLS